MPDEISEAEAGPADILDIEVPALMDAMRVDRAIAMLTERSRSSAVAMIADGLVVVDGAVVTKASFPLLEGAHLEVALPTLEAEQVEADPTVEVDLVHVDGDVVIVSKRFDQVVHPGAGNKEGTLVAGRLSIVHPRTGDVLTARAPWPDDLAALGGAEEAASWIDGEGV